MKQLMFIIGFLIASFILFSSFSPGKKLQDLPKGEKYKTHLTMMTVENGKTTVLDTVVEEESVFVWHGDTICSGDEMKWIGMRGLKPDSIRKNIRFHVIGPEGEDFSEFAFDSPPPPPPPHFRHAVHISKKMGRNEIDLNDPGIISFERKTLSNGREKITIIREKAGENDQSGNN